MIVKELMSRNVVTVSPEETVSAALSKMRKNMFHQLPVVDKELKGMLVLKNVVTKDVDASSTKVSSLMTHVSALSEDMDAAKAAEKILLSGFHALPVVKDGVVVGVLSETDMMRTAGDFMSRYMIGDIMVECDVASAEDALGKVKHIMAYKNVSRVPVVKDGHITGSVESLNLIDILMRKEPMQRGGLLKDMGAKEKVSIDATPVTSIMKDATVVDKKMPLGNAAELLTKKEELFVEDAGRFYVVTPKDVTELIARGKAEGVYVQIVNLGDVDAVTNAKMEKNITEFVQKMAHMIDIQSFVVHVERYEKGGKTRYDIRTRLFSAAGLYVSRSAGWNILSVFQDAIGNLEREILKKHGKAVKREEAKKAKQLRRE